MLVGLTNGQPVSLIGSLISNRSVSHVSLLFESLLVEIGSDFFRMVILW